MVWKLDYSINWTNDDVMDFIRQHFAKTIISLSYQSFGVFVGEFNFLQYMCAVDWRNYISPIISVAIKCFSSHPEHYTTNA